MQSKSTTKKGKKSFSIYVFGNPLLPEDSLPLRLLPQLRNLFQSIRFIELDPTEEFPSEKHLIIMDTILNIDHIILLHDIDSLTFQPHYSLHDFDVSFQLHLLKKLGKIQDVTLIGVPPAISETQALLELKNIIPSLLSKNAMRN